MGEKNCAEAEISNMEIIQNPNINLPLINEYASSLSALYAVPKEQKINWLLKAVTLIDLTTLSGDDTASNCRRLCCKAAFPIKDEILNEFKDRFEHPLKCAAVCVYPARVRDAYSSLKKTSPDIPVAAVATGFPSGQYHIDTRLAEIKMAIGAGASEIDIVISRELVLAGKWSDLYEEIREMKKACGDTHMKTILAVGELGSLSNVYKASMIAMRAGSDFIKTSTGKESVNATIPVGIVMCRAIREFHAQTGIKVGFKPAGGIKTADDALLWLTMINEELGAEWLDKRLFRIGASSLLGNIERQLYFYLHGFYPKANELPL